MDLNFETICRLCLERGSLKSIFKTTRSYELTKISCSEMVVSFASVTAEENDGLPAHICTKCISKLKAAYSFKKQCEISYKILLENFNVASDNLVKKEQYSTYDDELQDNGDIKIEDEDVKHEQIDVEETKLENFDDTESFTVFNQDNGYNDSDADVPIILLKERCVKVRRLKKLKNSTVRKKQKKSKIVVKSTVIENADEVDKSQRENRSNDILGIDVKSLRTEDGKFHCNQCPKNFSCRRSFVRHLERHLGIKSYFCDICQKCMHLLYSAHFRELQTSTDYARKWVHMQTHKRPREKRFQCDQCEKMFESKGALNIHASIHSENKPFICSECGKAFKRLDRLEIHKKVHTDVKEYMCQFCSRDFRVQKNLITHIMYKHTKERPYQCTRCEKRFVTSQCLKIHERRHLGIKNYHCEYCDKSFVSRSGVLTHLKMHTKEKPHPCRVCSVKFGRTDHRNRHEMTAHGKNFKSQIITK